MHHRNVGWSSHHNLWIPIGEKVYLFVSLLLFGLSSGKRPWKIINSGAAFLRLPQQNARGTKGAVNEKEEDKCARLERCWLGDCLCTVLQYLRKHPHKQTHTRTKTVAIMRATRADHGPPSIHPRQPSACGRSMRTCQRVCAQSIWLFTHNILCVCVRVCWRRIESTWVESMCRWRAREQHIIVGLCERYRERNWETTVERLSSIEAFVLQGDLWHCICYRFGLIDIILSRITKSYTLSKNLVLQKI